MFLLKSLMVKRRAVTFRIDERIIEAIEKAAIEVNNSKNKYLELLMLEHCIDKGLLPKNFKPLGETRGGDRTSKAERTKKEENDN